MNTDLGERNARLTVSSPQVRTGRCSFRSAHHLVYQHLVTAETIPTVLESDEVLIADPRGSLTPAQMVDRKLLALLGSCSRSLRAGTNGPANSMPIIGLPGQGRSILVGRFSFRVP